MFGIYNDYYDKNGNCVKTLIDGPALCGVYRGKPFQEHFDVLASYYLVATKMLRRACIEADHLRFPERTLGEDGLFYVAFMRQNPSCLVAIQKPLYHYTFARSASLSTPGIRSGCRTIFYLSDAVWSVVEDWGCRTAKCTERKPVTVRCGFAARH